MGKYSVVIVVSLAMFILVIDSTMMNVSITALTQDLNTTIQNIQLAITLYALVMASSMIIAAKLGNIYGTKRIFLIGSVIYGIGTLTAAISPNVVILILGWSLLEGVGAAFMMPATASFLMTTYQGKDKTIAFAILGAVAAGGVAIGPIVGGVFTTYASWRWAFTSEFIIVVIILISSGALKGEKSVERPKLDIVGALLAAMGMVSLVYGLIITTDYGWWQARQPFVIGGLEIEPFGISIAPLLMLFGLFILMLFVLWQRRQDRKGNEPLISASLMRNRPYLIGATASLMLQLCLAALLFTIPFFLQSMLFKSAIDTGIALMPMTLAMLVLIFVAARLAARLPVKYLMITGSLCGGAGLIVLAHSFRTSMSTIDLIPGLLVFGFGMGLAWSQSQNFTQSFAKSTETDEASGLYTTFRNLGMSIGTALVVTLMLVFFFSGAGTGIDGSSVLPQENKDELTTLLTENAKHMNRDELEAEIRATLADYPDEYIEELDVIGNDALGDSMRGTYYVLAGIMGLCLLTCLFLPKKKLDSDIDNDAEGGDTEPDHEGKRTRQRV